MDYFDTAKKYRNKRIKKLISIGELKSEIIEIDLKQNIFRRLNLRKNENCLLCSKVKK